MTRARVQALRDKVNSLLVALDMDDTLDGMLPHASVLCILRYTPAGAVHDGRKELNKTVARKEKTEPSRPWRCHRHSLAVPPLSTGGAGCATARQPEVPPLIRQIAPVSETEMAVPPPSASGATATPRRSIVPEPAVPPLKSSGTTAKSSRAEDPEPAVPPPAVSGATASSGRATNSTQRCHR